MKLLAAVIAAFLIANGVLFVWGPSPYGEKHAIDIDGRERTYLLHDGQPGAAPLLLALHPAEGFAHQHARQTAWNQWADQNGFSVVYPQAIGRVPNLATGWNAGHCCGVGSERDVADLAFLDALIADLVQQGVADPARVYMAGHSSGGMMTYRYAAEGSHPVAAIGVVAAALGSGPAGEPPMMVEPPHRPIPLLHIHGDADRIVPFEGGNSSSLASWNFVGAVESVTRWADAASLGTPRTQHDRDATVIRWSGSAQVALIQVHGAGHSWMGGAANPFGVTPSRSLDATLVLGTFFADHAASL